MSGSTKHSKEKKNEPGKTISLEDDIQRSFGGGNGKPSGTEAQSLASQDREKAEREKAEQEKIEKEKAAREKKAAEKIEREKKEQAKKDLEKAEREKKEQARKAQAEARKADIKKQADEKESASDSDPNNSQGSREGCKTADIRSGDPYGEVNPVLAQKEACVAKLEKRIKEDEMSDPGEVTRLQGQLKKLKAEIESLR